MDTGKIVFHIRTVSSRLLRWGVLPAQDEEVMAKAKKLMSVVENKMAMPPPHLLVSHCKLPTSIPHWSHSYERHGTCI